MMDLTVSQLIDHLRTLPPYLPVYRTIFDDGYNYYPLLIEDVRKDSLENTDTGKEFDCVCIGDVM